MKIGILGTGNVGQALGGRWLKKGREVQFGTRRNLDEVTQELRSRPKSATSSFDAVQVTGQGEILATCDLVVLASPWPETREILQAMASDRPLILVDCLNPLLPDLSGLNVPEGSSTAELLAEDLPRASVIKAFNCASAGTMANPNYGAGQPSILLCGDDADAKAKVSELVELIDFDPVDVGLLSLAGHLESMAFLTIKMAIHNGWGGDCAMQILRREKSPE